MIRQLQNLSGCTQSRSEPTASVISIYSKVCLSNEKATCSFKPGPGGFPSSLNLPFPLQEKLSMHK